MFVAGRASVLGTNVITDQAITNYQFTSSEDRMSRLDSASTFRQRSRRLWKRSMQTLATVLSLLALGTFAANAQTATLVHTGPAPGAPGNICSGLAPTFNLNVTPPLQGLYAVNNIAYVAPVGVAGNEVNIVTGPGQFTDEQVFEILPGNIVRATNGLDFTFTYFGTQKNLTDESVFLGANGFLRFSDLINNNVEVNNQGLFPQNIPAAGEPNDVIYFLNTDFNPQAGEVVWYEVQNIGGEDVLVVTFDNVSQYNDLGGPYPYAQSTVQLLIWADGGANAGRIEVRLANWADPVFAGANHQHTIGIENLCGNANAYAASADHNNDTWAVANGVGEVANERWEWVPNLLAPTQGWRARLYVTGTNLTPETWDIDGAVVPDDLNRSNAVVAGNPTALTSNTALPFGAAQGVRQFFAVVEFDNCTYIRTPVVELTVNQTPVAQTPTGPNNVCTQAATTFGVSQSVPGSTFGSWSTTAGANASIVVGTNITAGDQATITFLDAATGGLATTAHVISVVETSPAGCTVTSTKNVTVYLKPSGTIGGGTAAICAPATGSATTPAFNFSGTPLSSPAYSWSLTGTVPTGVVVNTPTAATTTITVPSSFVQPAVPAVLNVQLVVTNGNGIVSPACNTTITTPITINPAPSNKTIVASDDTPCQNQPGLSYSFDAGTPVVGANTYTWSLSGVGFTVTDVNHALPTVGKGSLTGVTWNGSGTGVITVVEATPQGCTKTHTLNTTIQALPSPTIIGSNTPCTTVPAITVGNPTYQTTPNPYQYTYTLNSFNALNTYSWTLPLGGGTIIGASNGASITVQWTAAGPRSVQVSETTPAPYGCVGTSVLNVTVQGTPLSGDFQTSGPLSVCTGTTHNYTTSGAGNHTFTIVGGTFQGGTTYPGSATQRAGAGAGTLQILWTSVPSGTISHEYEVGGCSAVETYTITINPLPSGTIDGPGPLCVSAPGPSPASYSVGNVGNGPITTYAWSEILDANNIATFSTATNLPTVGVNYANVWPLTSATWTLQVVITNANGCQATIQRVITATMAPNVGLTALTGPANACASNPTVTGTSNYTFTGQAGVTAYTTSLSGSVPAGSTVSVPTPGAGAKNFTATWGTSIAPNNLAPTSTPVTINVTAANGTCVGPTQTFVTNVFQTPAIPTITFPPLCVGMTLPVNVNVSNNGNAGQPGVTYTWSATGGMTFGAAAGVNNTITAVGAAGNKTVTITATGPNGCTNTLTQVVNVAPAPSPTILGPLVACNELENPVGKAGTAAFGFSYEYRVAAPTAGYSYTWSITNGYVISTGNGAGNSLSNPLGTVAAISPAALNQNAARVVFYGPTPGNVKVTEIHPAGCTGTFDIDVTLNPIPVVQTIGVTPQNICVGATVTFNQTASEAGATYRLERSTNGGLSWSNVGVVATQNGPGALVWNVPASVLTYNNVGSEPTPTTYLFRITAQTAGCGWYVASNNATVNVYPVPATNLAVTIATNIVCTPNNVLVDIAGSQSWVLYSLERTPITDANGNPVAISWAPVAGASAVGNGGVLTLTDITNPAGGNPLLNVNNYRYRVSAQIDPAFVPPVACQVFLTQTPEARVFALPTAQAVTYAPNPVCWEQPVDVTLTASQDGVVYEVLRNGLSMSPAVTVNGAVGNGSVTVQVPALSVLGSNPAVPTNVTFSVIGRLRTGSAPYNRPVPASLCPNTFGAQVVVVNPKPVATVNGSNVACGPSTMNYTAAAGAHPATYDWTLVTAPAGSNPAVANNSGVGTVNPFTVNWGTVLLSCNGSYNPFAAQLRMIETNTFGCADTAFFNVTVQPTVADATIGGDSQACIYGGFENHLETYTVSRPGGCVFPAGTTYLWTMPSAPAPVTGVIRSGQGTTSIVAEWNTTGGTNVGTVQCVVTLPLSHGGCATTVTYNVIVYPLPVPVVNGPVQVCQGQQNVTYIADLYPTDTYNWQVIGGTIVGGTGNGIVGDTAARSGLALNTIQINWLDAANPNAFIRLRQVSAAGCMNVTNFNVTVNPTPTPVVDGPSIVCNDRDYTFTTQNNAPANTYAWSVSGNAVVVSGTNTASFTVKSTTAGSFTVTVTETVSATSCTKTASKTVQVVNAPAPSITRVSPLPGTVGGACVGQTITYTAGPNVLGRSYKWTVVGGTIAGADNAFAVNVTWNTAGNHSIALNEWVTGSQCTTSVNQPVQVSNTPDPAIAGPLTVCGTATHTYSTPLVAGNAYTWSATGPATIIAGGNTNSATIQFAAVPANASGSATITVTETNTNGGCSVSENITVTVRYQPVPQTIARLTVIGGNSAANQACANDVITYQVNPDNRPGSAYNWSVTGGVIVGPANGNTVTVQWTSIGAQTLTLVETTSAGTTCSATSTLNVSVSYRPTPSISGTTTVCTENVVTYTTANVAGSTYAWSLPLGGGTITSGATSNTITVLWTVPGPRSVQVVETNGLCATTATVNVSVGLTPTTTNISRVGGGNLNQACQNAVVAYTTQFNGSSSYQWTATGANITGGATTNTVTVQWTGVGNQTLTVVETTTGTNCSKTASINVSVTYQPVPAITGPATVCTGNVVTYTTPAVAGSTYNWTLPLAGGTILSGATSNTITVEWTTSGPRSVRVVETNGNCSAQIDLNVSVGQTPTTTTVTRVTPGGPVGQACEGQIIQYSTPNNAGNTYAWTVTGGNFTTPANTATVSVQWATVGNQVLSVTETTVGTNCSRTVTQNVSVTEMPVPIISGSTISCINKIHTYSTNAVPGNQYLWEITPANVFAPVTGWNNSNTISVQWTQPGLHRIIVTETSTGGYCTARDTIFVQVNLVPNPQIVSGNGFGSPTQQRPGLVCEFSTHTYNVAAPGVGNVFEWTVTGGTIIGGQFTSSITVTWGSSGPGTIAVRETVPGSDCSTLKTDDIDIRRRPTPVITGNVNPCANSEQFYETPFVAGNEWLWTVSLPAGSSWNVVPGQPNRIRVVWANVAAATAAQISVREFVTGTLPAPMDPAACFGTNTMNLTVRPLPPVITITGPTPVCASDDTDTPVTTNVVTYTSSNPADGTTAAWTISSNGQIVGSSTGFSINARWFNTGSTQTTGTLTVTHTSPFGCVRAQSLSVTINPLPNPVITGPASACQGSQQSYSVVGFPGHSYIWTVSAGNLISGANTPNVSVTWTQIGVNTLRVSETNTFGCTVINEFRVTVNELPAVNVLASGPTTFCQGGDVTLSAPLGFASYVWSTGETSRNIVVRSTGNYFVIVTDANGCSNSSDTVTVNVFPSRLPIVSSSGPLTFCEGGSVTLTAPADFGVYRWSNGATTRSITVTETGIYTVTVADTNGCTGTSDDVEVTVYPAPQPVLTVVGSTTVCDGDSVELRAPQGFASYEWISSSGTNYGNGRTIVVKATDTVSVRVVSAEGCVGTSEEVVITLSTVAPPTLTVNGPTTFCEGNAVVLSAPSGYDTYIWSNGAVGREITVTESGTFSVIVSNANLCSAQSVGIDVTVNALPARPSIARFGDTLNAVTVATPESYQWYLNGTMIAGATNSKLVVAQGGTYRVEVIDGNTCTNISQPFDVILTSVDDVVAGYAPARVFPNPTNGTFTIEIANMPSGDVTIELVNTLGERVMTISDIANGGQYSKAITMGELASGMYNVVVISGNQRYSLPVVRQ